MLTEQIETDPTWQTYKQNKSKQTKLVSNKSLPNQRTEPTRQTYQQYEQSQTYEIYEKHQHAKLTNRNEPKQMKLVNRKRVKPTNGTNMPKMQLEPTESNETYQQKNIVKPTNGTNMQTYQHVKPTHGKT